MPHFISIAILAIFSSYLSINQARADIFDAKVICKVEGIKKGKLALRKDDHQMKPFAYLSNGDVVQAYGGSVDYNYPKVNKSWYGIKVQQSSNPLLKGKEGIVNSAYLKCKWYDQTGKLIRED
ncbi:MAG: hypothetical protein SFU25_02260 [Candidatus Caenarcaniphilales bacterium]|nr:hypothetical protein [Candidatus Caenarcaniphilales bacterium]